MESPRGSSSGDVRLPGNRKQKSRSSCTASLQQQAARMMCSDVLHNHSLLAVSVYRAAPVICQTSEWPVCQGLKSPLRDVSTTPSLVPRPDPEAQHQSHDGSSLRPGTLGIPSYGTTQVQALPSPQFIPQRSLTPLRHLKSWQRRCPRLSRASEREAMRSR